MKCLPGEPVPAYAREVVRSALSVLLALVCSVQVPALAQANFTPPQDVDARAEALYEAGKFIEAAQLYAQALSDLPERPDTRDQRNPWASGAVNAYKAAFERDTQQCATSHAGLALADDYLADLVEVHGDEARGGYDYTGMRDLREGLDQLRTRSGCPAPSSTSGPAPVVEGPTAQDQPAAPPEPAQRESRASQRRAAAGLAAGVGVSAALTVGMAIGTGILYSQLRKGGKGRYYEAIKDAAVVPEGLTADEYDMCADTSGHDPLKTACQDWESRHKGFLATAVLTGVFAASTAVFTALLIRQRRQPGPTTALLRRHQARIGATPHLGGGASLTAGFRF